jgi:uncharacterized protein (DUF58 family)
MQKDTPPSWFTIDELRSLKGMSWLARKVAYDVLSGIHSGRYLGQGTDFSQYRTYMPGDDLRRVDWKLYGRTDRLYIKESEMESRTRWYGILDASASMGYEEDNISKWQYAKVLWSAISFIAKQQGDADGLILINDKEMTHFPPNTGADHGRMHLLFNAKTKGNWPRKIVVPIQAGVTNKFIVITDFFEQADEVGSFIKSLIPSKNEVAVFHVMGKKEMNLDFAGITVFQDAETGALMETDSSRIRAEYKQKAEAFLIESRNKILGWGADYHLFLLPDSPVNNLKQYIKQKTGGGYVANR